MRGSHGKRMPSKLVCWLALANSNWQPAYSDLPGDVRQSIIDALWEAQRGLCVYCGRQLNIDQRRRRHVEHFRPQAKYPDLSVDLANLFLSCGPETPAGQRSEICGMQKAAGSMRPIASSPTIPHVRAASVFC